MTHTRPVATRAGEFVIADLSWADLTWSEGQNVRRAASNRPAEDNAQHRPPAQAAAGHPHSVPLHQPSQALGGEGETGVRRRQCRAAPVPGIGGLHDRDPARWRRRCQIDRPGDGIPCESGIGQGWGGGPCCSVARIATRIIGCAQAAVPAAGPARDPGFKPAAANRAGDAPRAARIDHSTSSPLSATWSAMSESVRRICSSVIR